jgi:hypothetical protein
MDTTDPEWRKIVRMLAMTVPGLARLAAHEIAELPGAEVRDHGYDGRSDVVLFELPELVAAVRALRTTEDLYVEVGRTLRSEGDDPRWIARRIWRRERVERALSTWAAGGGAGRPSSFRVIVRVLQERSFLRTELRRELTRTVQAGHPRWRLADPAELEIWISEYRPGRFVAGMRLTDALMRRHGGRTAERRGALRPVVAAAMVRLAGRATGMLVDPCCGSGTILAEAEAAGWQPWGRDIDPDAVAVARRNLPGRDIQVGDARHLELPGRAAAAVVSNLPFGHQFAVQGDEAAWLASVLDELARATAPGGSVVLLTPRRPRHALLSPTGSHRIRLLGTPATIWCSVCTA